MKPSLVAALAAVASLTPTVTNGAVLNLRPPADTTEAARLGEFGPDVPAMGRRDEHRRKQRAGKARKARRGWR